ncbi:ATP-binding protein [Methanolobus vulcani]|uniref:histidine kinase n=1 Tax=Methanolobus vulcani TaxID=38026 RepID=A0A7Z8KN26_9EURY|nr:ATP-binding protein [Methanolobus vulcani]TQD25161.1 transporter substrate-binding domain-containing protein [Methanolobus vulcani]
MNEQYLTPNESNKTKIRLAARTFLVFMTISFLLVTCAGANSTMELKVGVYPNEPLISQEQNGTAIGLYAEILESIASKEGWELKYVPGTLNQCYQKLDNGSIDILPAVPNVPEIEQHYILTTETPYTDWGIVYTYRGSGISSMSDLNGKRIAHMDDIFYENFNSSPRNSNISYSFISASSYIEIFEHLENKEIDAGIISRSYGEVYEDQFDLERIPFVISPTEMVFALSDDTDPEIAKQIDADITQMITENGTIHYMQENIDTGKTDEDLSTWESPSWLKFSVGIGVGLLLIFVILSLTLRNKVEEKTYELNSKNRELEVEIRERKIAEEKLKQYSLDLKDSNELKDLFTDILRHDLINPATVIKGYVEFLIEVEDEPQKKEAMKAIERNNKKLIELIENAAHLAKLENMDDMTFKTLDLKEIIEEVIEHLMPKLEEKNMNINFNPSGNYPADVNTTIEDVFSNLISNAIKYSPSGTIINIDVKDVDDTWEITISDEGEGIPDKEKPFVFDRFKRAHKVNIKGSGLGLAIVKRIVDLHEGSVEVFDRTDREGTTFKVTLQKTKI